MVGYKRLHDALSITISHYTDNYVILQISALYSLIWLAIWEFCMENGQWPVVIFKSVHFSLLPPPPLPSPPPPLPSPSSPFPLLSLLLPSLPPPLPSPPLPLPSPSPPLPTPPLPSPPRSGVGSPVVGEVDGEYAYDAKKHLLNWRLAVIDSSTAQGSMEFTIAGIPSDFFPVRVSFVSSKPYCNIEVRKQGECRTAI